MSSTDSKDLVEAFTKLALIDRQPAAAAARYLGETYTQHNPQVPDGPEAFATGIGAFLEQIPHGVFNVKRVIAEDDLVVVHTHLIPVPGAPGQAVVDIFRVEGGAIVEHWDVIQAVPEESANNNTMF